MTPLVRSATGKTRELSDGFAAEVKNIAGLTVNAYHRAIKHQLDFSIELADAVKVDWSASSPATTPRPSATSSRRTRARRTTC